MKLIRKKKKDWVKVLQELDEKYPIKDNKIKDWNKGGFVDDEKYKQPIKHKKYK